MYPRKQIRPPFKGLGGQPPCIRACKLNFTKIAPETVNLHPVPLCKLAFTRSEDKWMKDGGHTISSS